MSMEPTTWEEAIRAWVEMVLQGEDPAAIAYFEHGSGPRSAAVYATVQVLSNVATSMPVDEVTDTPAGDPGGFTFLKHTHSPRVGTVAVKVYGQAHAALAQQLELAISDDDSQSFFDGTGVRVLAPIGGLPTQWAALGTKWDGFTPIDFRFTFSAQRTVGVYSIETATVTET